MCCLVFVVSDVAFKDARVFSCFHDYFITTIVGASQAVHIDCQIVEVLHEQRRCAARRVACNGISAQWCTRLRGDGQYISTVKRRETTVVSTRGTSSMNILCTEGLLAACVGWPHSNLLLLLQQFPP